MKIVINTSVQRFGGAIQVALSFINECIGFADHEYHVWIGPGVKKSLKTDQFPDNFYFYYFDFGEISLTKIFLIQHELSKYEKQIKPDCIISTSGPSYFHSEAPQILGYNLPLYIYTESPYVKNWPIIKRIRLGLRKLAQFYFFKRDTWAYVVQTDDVNLRVRKKLGSDRVYTVTNTFNGFYTNRKKYPSKLPPKVPGQIRFLTISAYYPHKNLEIIMKVIALLVEQNILNFQFIITVEDEQFRRHFGQYKYSPYLINLGPVLPEECPSLYDECDIMFLPTLAECFSASYPESMIMEKPIITTELGFARSICGDAALYFEPMNAVSALETIKELLNNNTLRNQLIENGKKRLNYFDTSKQRAGKYLEICKKALRYDR